MLVVYYSIAWPYPDRMRILKTRTSKSSTLAATWSQNPLSFSVEHAPATICDQGNWMSAWTTCQLSLPICSQKLWTEVRAVLQKKTCWRAVLMLGEWLGGSTNVLPSNAGSGPDEASYQWEALRCCLRSFVFRGSEKGSLWRTTRFPGFSNESWNILGRCSTKMMEDCFFRKSICHRQENNQKFMSPDSLNLFFLRISFFFWLKFISHLMWHPIFDMKPGGDADASRPDFTQRLQAAKCFFSTALFGSWWWWW